MDSQSLENNVTKLTISKEEDEAYVHALGMCTSFIVPHVLSAANELDLFEIIAKEGGSFGIPCLSASDIASHIPTKNSNAGSALEHMLSLLACHSLLTCSSRTLENGKIENLYGLAPAGKFFVKNVDGVSLASFSVITTERFLMEMCLCIKDSVLEGVIPFCKANKMSVFEHMATDQKIGKEFDKAMSDNSTMIIKRFLQTYKGFEGITSLVDCGGGIGTTLNMIISAHPSIAGINFDLPRAIERAPSYNTGIKHVGGDMLVDIPKADAILLKSVLHDFNDEECLMILKNCYRVLPDTGKVIIIDAVIPKTPNTSSLDKCLFQLDSMMFMEFGATDRTEQDFKALSKGAGFTKFEIEIGVYGQCVMELYKED